MQSQEGSASVKAKEALIAQLPYSSEVKRRQSQLSLKQQHEIAVANRLIKCLALPATFLRVGDHTKNEPDVIYSYQRGLLGVEVATAYTDDTEAEQEWNIARGKIKVPHGTLVYIWGGEEPDKKMCARIQREIDDKCARDPYSGVDRVWLCLEQIPGISSESSAINECVKQLCVPERHGFEKIFLHYFLHLFEGNEWHSVELWPGSSSMITRSP